MKKRIAFLSLSLMLIAALKLNAQQAPTTSAEYLYGSVGYKLQLNNKLPMKEGYTLRDFSPVVEDTRQVEFKGLYRNGEKIPCAVIMIYTRLRMAPQYYCIPSADADAELWKKFNASLLDDSENQQPQLQFFAYCIAHLSAQLAMNNGK
ncbi:MAG: hypothetical protein M9940_01330 [Bacteroidetes bacterium]|nr:MAG: hypothetical protein UZ10_BCD003001926 [Bacteroidetes bacterium OLB10]MBV6453935.1 hypothetical protein [Bacteroidia bacterium]MCO5288048.1 hypothetical protein [Bacteroidota bacterium]MCB8931400.1 hypothetical protein [Bacteroidia bacterium]MCW5930160.1 hypothetical protein [Bacteroidota bacterium]